MSGFTPIQADTLEDILRMYFGAENPFKEPEKPVGELEADDDYTGWLADHFTEEGWNAYLKLQCLVRDLDRLLGEGLVRANDIEDELDSIAVQ